VREDALFRARLVVVAVGTLSRQSLLDAIQTTAHCRRALQHASRWSRQWRNQATVSRYAGFLRSQWRLGVVAGGGGGGGPEFGKKFQREVPLLL